MIKKKIYQNTHKSLQALKSSQINIAGSAGNVNPITKMFHNLISFDKDNKPPS